MSIFSKLIDFVKGAVPLLSTFRDVAELIGSVIKIGIGSNDKQKIGEAISAMRDLVSWVRLWADELEQVADASENAISESSQGGDDITASEALQIGDELADIGPASAEVGKKAAALAAKLRGLV